MESKAVQYQKKAPEDLKRGTVVLSKNTVMGSSDERLWPEAVDLSAFCRRRWHEGQGRQAGDARDSYCGGGNHR